jgi:hypothetical protein
MDRPLHDNPVFDREHHQHRSRPRAMGDVRLLIGCSALALRGDFQRDLRRSAGRTQV